MEIGPDKTKLMTNNPDGFQREINIKSQRLEDVKSFKHLFDTMLSNAFEHRLQRPCNSIQCGCS